MFFLRICACMILLVKLFNRKENNSMPQLETPFFLFKTKIYLLDTLRYIT